jgi:hypothetical protein
VCKKILERYFFNFLNAGGNLWYRVCKKYWRSISLMLLNDGGNLWYRVCKKILFSEN